MHKWTTFHQRRPVQLAAAALEVLLVLRSFNDAGISLGTRRAITRKGKSRTLQSVCRRKAARSWRAEHAPACFGTLRAGVDLGRHGRPGSVYAGYHYDLNFLTVHGRSRFPGLAVWLRDGARLPVGIPPGCLLIQAGKQLEWLTAGRVRAGMHEARGPPRNLLSTPLCCHRLHNYKVRSHRLQLTVSTACSHGLSADCERSLLQSLHNNGAALRA